VSEAGCLGAAILAATAVGQYRDVDQGVKAAVRRVDEFRPNPKSVKLYREHFETYRGIYEAVKHISWQIPG